MMAQINIKIDDSLKEDTAKAFFSMELDLFTGIKIYLTRITQDNKLPLTPRHIGIRSCKHCRRSRTS